VTRLLVQPSAGRQCRRIRTGGTHPLERENPGRWCDKQTTRAAKMIGKETAMPKDGQLIGPADIAPGTAPCGSLRDVIEPFAFVALLVIPLLAFFAALSLPATVTIPAGAGLALSLFIPMLCGLSVLMKHNRSRRRRESVMQMDQVGATQYFQIHVCKSQPALSSRLGFRYL
jgi:hypothetical protein